VTNLLTNTPVYHGTTRTRAMYKGGTKVWPPAAPAAGGGPEEISGCVLALNATDVPAGPVATWPDRSPEGNNVSVWSGSPVSTGEYVTCTTANTLSTAYGILVTGAAPRHLFMMIRSRWVGGSFMGYGASGSGQLFDLWYYTGQGTLIWHGHGGGYDTVSGAPTFTADQWHLVELSYDGTTMRISLDDGAPQVVTPPALLTAPTQFLFGQGRYSPAGDFDMKSFYFYDRVLTGTERDQVRASMVAEPPWTPESLTGLAVWLDAIDYQPGLWPNKAEGGATTQLQRSVPSPVWAPGTKNGLPVVRFTVNEGRLRIPSGSGVGVEWTLVYVGRMVGPSAARVVTGIYTPNNLLVGYWNNNQDVMYDAGFTTNGQGVPVVLGAWKMYSADGTAGFSQFYANGALLGSTTSSAGWGGTFAISGYSLDGVEETSDCEIAEVVQYNRKLTDVERQQVETYLREKWAIT
jgi:hypothetical protein